jgi:hypothetical protein
MLMTNHHMLICNMAPTSWRPRCLLPMHSDAQTSLAGPWQARQKERGHCCYSINHIPACQYSSILRSSYIDLPNNNFQCGSGKFHPGEHMGKSKVSACLRPSVTTGPNSLLLAIDHPLDRSLSTPRLVPTSQPDPTKDRLPPQCLPESRAKGDVAGIWGGVDRVFQAMVGMPLTVV